MSFKIQQPGTGLFWASGGDRIRLASEGSTYEIDSEGHIRNVDTGMYIRHSYFILMDASELEHPEYDFEWTIEESGSIYNAYDGGHCVVPDGDSLRINKISGATTSWVIVREVPAEVPVEVPAEVPVEVPVEVPAEVPIEEEEEVSDEEDDVPVSRVSALIEEALNAKAASCGCECGCGPDCQGCECECGCPKVPAEAPIQSTDKDI